MAIKQLGRLAEEAIAKFALHRMLIVHRIGEVPVGMASVVVGCSGAHRAEVFTAVPWVMDNLKRDVPIWKRETFHDGETMWVHPKEGGP
jgi:molybdopterin synthase catalytic subunit